jgi:hypothetical protein
MNADWHPRRRGVILVPVTFGHRFGRMTFRGADRARIENGFLTIPSSFQDRVENLGGLRRYHAFPGSAVATSTV